MNEWDAKEAADHYLKPEARFGDLLAGEQFRFPGSETIMTKTRSGYRSGKSPVFKTGRRVAVIKVNS